MGLSTKTRVLLIGLAFALIAASAAATFWWNRPTTLTIVAGPTGSDQSKLVTALAQALARERAGVRLRVIGTEYADGGLRLDRGESDLAIVRGDLPTASNAAVVAIWQRNPVLLAAPAVSGIERWTDLQGKTVGVIGRGIGVNLRLIDTILREHQVAPSSVRTVEVLPWEMGEAVREGRIQAIVTIGPATFRPVADAVAGLVRESAEGKVTLVPVREAAAIADRVPFLESMEIVAGAFGSNPPRPADALPTVGVVHYLMVRRDVPDAAVAELTQQLFALRPRLAAQHPAALRIETPDTDKDSTVRVHPGAHAYLTGEQKTFLDLYADYIYITIFGLSLLASAFAAGAGLFGWGRPPAEASRLPEVITLIREARDAETSEALDDVSVRADEIFIEAIGLSQRRGIDSQDFAALTMALDHLRAGIADRRRALALAYDDDYPEEGAAPVVAAAPVATPGYIRPVPSAPLSPRG